MGKAKYGRCRRGVRPAMVSDGRPGSGLRETLQRFWERIAQGLQSEKAAIVAGVSPAVGVRWLLQNGGMPNITLAPLSIRFLSLFEH